MNEKKSDNIYQKLAKARRYVKEHPIKKEGYNSYSNYKYYEPEQIENLVFEACDPLGLTTLFNLVEKQTGIVEKITRIYKPIVPLVANKDKKQNTEPSNLIKKEVHKAKVELRGTLKVIDVETQEFIEFEMPTKIPEITATNEAQKLGGSVTICKRQLQTTALGIAENDLDPDTTENTRQRENGNPNYRKEPPQKKQTNKPSFSDLENNANIPDYDPNQYQPENSDPFAGTKQAENKNLFSEAEKDKNNETEAHKRIRQFMLNHPDICGETDQAKQNWLQNFTKFADDTGKENNGVRLIRRLSPKWAGKVWGDIKREYAYILENDKEGKK